jgi:hypothetical protein
MDTKAQHLADRLTEQAAELITLANEVLRQAQQQGAKA